MEPSRPPESAVTELLHGAWRETPPPRELDPARLAAVVSRLTVGGAGGLAWWVVKDGALAASEQGEALHDVFRIQALDGRDSERRLEIALDLLRGAGVEPVLAKGWALARLYPHHALRPYGDLDLYVDPEAFDVARRALDEHGEGSLRVDLHRGLPGGAVHWANVERLAIEAPVGETTVRVLGDEHHLGLICPHMLEHGAWRPVWLCDVAVMAEGRPDLDWDLAVASARRPDTVGVAVRLARELLGADVDRSPWADAGPLPAWIPTSVERAWLREHYSTTTSIATEERTPTALGRSARSRWPNQIETAMRWNRPFTNAPRWPFQLLDVATRTIRMIRGA